MSEPQKERRKHPRYDTKVKLYFNLNYDLETKVDYRVIQHEDSLSISRKYTAFSKNVSTDGMCFNSEKQLTSGDILHMEVYLPDEKKPIAMTGEVRWSKPVEGEEQEEFDFNTGVRVLNVGKENVYESIHFDKDYNVEWSVLLESVLGKYRLNSLKRKKTK